MHEARAYTVPMKSPDDVSAIAALFESGDVEPGHVCAIIAQTEGDGFARGYFTLAFETLMATRLGIAPDRVRATIPVLAIGGTAGLMTPHATLFVRQPAPDAPPVHARALALGIAFTRTLEPEEIGSVSQVMLVAEAVAQAMTDAGIGDPADVAAVEIKCPQPEPAAAPPGTHPGLLGARSRGASALGAAIALGEINQDDISDSAIGSRHDLYARRASASSGGELHNVRIVVIGNRAGAPGAQCAGHGVMEDQLDMAGAAQAFRRAGLDLHQGQLDTHGTAKLRAVFVNAGADSTDSCRDHRHTMRTDLLAGYSGHIAKAVAHATVSAIAQTPLILGNAGAEHQGPPGGNLVCVIATQEPADPNKDTP